MGGGPEREFARVLACLAVLLVSGGVAGASDRDADGVRDAAVEPFPRLHDGDLLLVSGSSIQHLDVRSMELTKLSWGAPFRVREVQVGADGTIYALAWDGIFEIDPRTGERALVALLDSRTAHSLTVDGDGHLLVLASESVVRVDPRDGSVERLFERVAFSGLTAAGGALFAVFPGYDWITLSRTDELLRLDADKDEMLRVHGGDEWRCGQFATCFGEPIPTSQRVWAIDESRLLVGGGWWSGRDFQLVSLDPVAVDYLTFDEGLMLEGAARVPTSEDAVYLVTSEDVVVEYDLSTRAQRILYRAPEWREFVDVAVVAAVPEPGRGELGLVALSCLAALARRGSARAPARR